MRRKNITGKLIKEYISEALLILMKTKDYSQITIGEITKRAGVNRSTYYRHFASKEDIIQSIFQQMIDEFIRSISSDENIEQRQYLEFMFAHFYKYKNTLLLIHKNGLSYLLLASFNDYLTDFWQVNSIERKYEIYYHSGGIFNSFLLWFEQGMSILPKDMTNITLTYFPKNFKPMLLK